MNDALAGAGENVTLVFPYVYMKENLALGEIHRFYNTRNHFRVRMLWTPLTLRTPGIVRRVILFIAFFTASLRILLGNIGSLRSVVVISRDSLPLIPFILLKKISGTLLPVRLVLQMHELKKGSLHRWVYRSCSGLMPNVPHAKKLLMETEAIPGEKMMVMNAPMVDFSMTDCSKPEAREKIKYDSAAPLVVYTGKVGKGIAELEYILEAAAMLPGYHFIFTGGKEQVVNDLRKWSAAKNLNNVTFTGFFDDLRQVRYYQLAADVLVSYYTVKDHLVEFNYPQKLQEYLSTHNPVVTPDFEATREVVNSENAFLTEPDNPQALAEAIKHAVTDKALAKKKANAAFRAAGKITFDYRVPEFISFFNRLE